MPLYWVRYVDGCRALGVGQLTARGMGDAVAEAEHWARNYMLKAPVADWSRWRLELTSQDNGTTRIAPFPSFPKDHAAARLSQAGGLQPITPQSKADTRTGPINVSETA